MKHLQKYYCYSGEKPSLRGLFCGNSLEAYLYMERIPIDQVPNDEKECDKWMYDIFEKKVGLLHYYNSIIFNDYKKYNFPITQ